MDGDYPEQRKERFQRNVTPMLTYSLAGIIVPSTPAEGARAGPAMKQIFIGPAFLQSFGSILTTNLATGLLSAECAAHLQTFEVLESELILSRKAI